MQFFGPSASIYCPGAAKLCPNATILAIITFMQTMVCITILIIKIISLDVKIPVRFLVGDLYLYTPALVIFPLFHSENLPPSQRFSDEIRHMSRENRPLRGLKN